MTTATATENTTDQPNSGDAENLAALDRLAADLGDFDPGEIPEGGAANDETAEPAGMETGALCTALLSMSFGLIASRKGKHWALTPEEATETGNALGDVLDKYFPDMGNHGPELTALMCCGMVLTPRLMMDAKLAAAEEERRAKAAKPVGEAPAKPYQQAASEAEKRDAPRFDPTEANAGADDGNE